MYTKLFSSFWVLDVYIYLIILTSGLSAAIAVKKGAIILHGPHQGGIIV